jgi:DNA-binding GntR family transcriptional regulator
MSTSLVAALSLRLDLDEQGAVPLFRQLYAGLRAAIMAGRLEGGTRLPPTRHLAVELRLSRKTVVNAFEQLIAEGYLEGKVGSGAYVAQVLPEEVLQISRSAGSVIASTPSQMNTGSTSTQSCLGVASRCFARCTTRSTYSSLKHAHSSLASFS